MIYIERIAHVCHEANRALQVTGGEEPSPHFSTPPNGKCNQPTRGFPRQSRVPRPNSSMNPGAPRVSGGETPIAPPPSRWGRYGLGGEAERGEDSLGREWPVVARPDEGGHADGRDGRGGGGLDPGGGWGRRRATRRG